MLEFLSKKKTLFLEYLEQIKGYSDLSIKSYNESINEALLSVEIEKIKDKIVINLMPYRVKIANLKAKTISKKLSAIRSFSSFLNENGIKVELKSDNSIKVAKTLPKPISDAHIKEALELSDTKEYLIISLLYTLGLRLSELESLKLENITNSWVRVTGKGSKQRDIPLLDEIRELIENYLLKYHPKIYLFEENGEKLSQNSLRYIITKVFKKVGLKVTPHQLRHSYATELLNNNAPIADVSKLLGHSSMATTQIYTKLSSKIKQQNYNLAHPLCKEDYNV